MLFLSLQVLGCSVNRHVYQKGDAHNRWIRTFGDYEEFRFQADQWIRITCWYHQIDDYSKGLEVGVVVPAELLGSLGGDPVEIYSLNFGDLEEAGNPVIHPGTYHFRFLKILPAFSRDSLMERIRGDTVYIRMGPEQYRFVGLQN